MDNLCILFDMDGTLLDSGAGITNAVAYATEKFNKPALDIETRKKFVGPPLRESFVKYCGVDAAEAEEMIALYREYYSAGGMYECEPYEGIGELLSHLSKQKAALYVATAKPQVYAVKMLEKWDILKYFKEVVGATFDKSRDDKKLIIAEILEKEKNKRAIMIGDTKYDIEAAHKNGIEAVAVTYGYGLSCDLLEGKPEFSADSVRNIGLILQDIMADN